MPLQSDQWIEDNSQFGAERLHALGVATINWNWCEYWAAEIFCVVANLKTQLAQVIAHDMGDVTLWQKIKDSAVVNSIENDAVDHLKHAEKVYDANRVNRNLLVHGHPRFNAAYTDLSYILRLERVKGAFSRGEPISDSLPTIRRVADEISILRKYLENVCICIGARSLLGREHPWPDKPSLPELIWTPAPQTPPRQKRPPQSSRA